MHFDPDKRDVVGQGPDPLPHAPKRLPVPVSAVDTHAHVVGHHFIERRSYTPPPASLDDYIAMLDATYMTFGVLIQVSVHGADNTLLLEALRAYPEQLRGVAVTPADTSDHVLADLQDAGVRGVRLNSATGGGVGLDQLERIAAICRELDWHVQFLTNPTAIREIAPRLARLPVPYVLDHLCDPDVKAGVATPDWDFVLGLVRDGAWVKLSSPNRLAEPPYQEVAAFARSLVEAAPDRCVYGSDWPHVGFWGPMPNDGDLADLLVDWAPDRATRDAILTTNAHRLYGFDAAHLPHVGWHAEQSFG